MSPPHNHEPLRQQMLRSLAAEGVGLRIITSADLGDGPHRPFGSAHGGKHVGAMEPLPRIGRTRRLMSEPPCPSCGNKSAWRCGCEEESE